MSQYTTILTPTDVVDYIKSLDRVGCKPFKFISPSVITKCSKYTLCEIHINDLDLSQVDGYSSDISARITRKITSEAEIQKYNKIYNCIDFPPIVVDNHNRLIDGFHRVAYFRDNGTTSIQCYKGEI
jgi:hypothetical protein